jgi:hypothetical protein
MFKRVLCLRGKENPCISARASITTKTKLKTQKNI